MTNHSHLQRKAWYLGNTTLRSPLRIKDGLEVLAESEFQGVLEGHSQEAAFARLLASHEVVRISDATSEKDVAFLGRKWRAAMMQLGFITPSDTDLERVGI